MPLSAPGSWSWSARASDVDALACAQPLWQLQYEQLAPGGFEGRLEHAQLPGLRLVLEQCSRAVRQRGDIGHDSYGFAMVLDPQTPAIFNGQRAQHDDVMLGRGDELDLCTPDDCQLLGAVVDRELLAPLWERMYQKPLARWLESQLVVAARPAAAAELRSLHLDALAHIVSGQAPLRDRVALLQMRDAILIEWIEALPEAVDVSELPGVAARKRLVDRACELMLCAPDEPLSMLEVCRRIGASRRKLNYCFQDVLGTSPVKYLRAVRLNGVRRDLRGGAQAVQDVAARWGFWHLGQFSRDYRLQFGERPSETLMRARGPGVRG